MKDHPLVLEHRLIPSNQGVAAVLEEATPAPRLLAVTATFTAEPLEESLQFWFAELRMPFTAGFAAYNQVFQQLLDPRSLLGANQSGANVVLVRLEDWLAGDTAGDRAALERNLNDLISALKGATSRTATPHFLVLCPVSPEALRESGRSAVLAEAEGRVGAELAGLPGVNVTTSAELAALYPVEQYYDAAGDKLGSVPYTPAFFAALGTVIVRKLHARLRPPHKVVVLDCDDTLWRGVCGEGGPDDIFVDRPRRALQEFMRAQKDAGMLLCLCSKNNEADVAEVFARRTDMPLRWEDFAARRVNWRPKSQNLVELGAELNLGLDSFIFVDDNPAECAEVSAHCPDALVVQLPAEPDRVEPFLRHLWAFDHLTVTAEDQQRTVLYQQARQRTEFQKESMSFADFISGLDLRVEIRPPRADELPRVAQLTQRTNQFNVTTVRRSSAEIQAVANAKDQELLVVKVADRFGDYGLVGVMIYGDDGKDLRLDTLLLSCRVLGRGVEHRMVARLGEIAREKDRRHIQVLFIPTQKNKPASVFLEEIGGAYRRPGSGGPEFLLPSAAAAAVRFNPAEAGSAPRTPEPMESGSGSPKLAATDAEMFNRIATDLNEAGRILRFVISHKPILLSKRKAESAAPRNATERTIAEIWAEVLGTEGIGIYDNFFDLGGHSFTVLRVVLRLNEVFKTDVSADALNDHPTIAALSALLEARSQDLTSVPMPENGERSQQPERSEVDLGLIAAVVAQHNRQAAPVAPGSPYRMRESWICRWILAPLYRFDHTSLRSLIQLLVLKLEGGHYFTVTLRKLYARHHDMHFGDYSACLDAQRFKPGTSVGRYTSIYPTVVVQTADHPRNTISTHAVFYHPAFGFTAGYELPRVELHVGNDVWIGHNATILYPTRNIGDGAVIAAGSIVVGDVPPYAIVGGYPARVLRYRFSNEKIEALLKSRWWEASLEELEHVKDQFARPLEGDRIR